MKPTLIPTAAFLLAATAWPLAAQTTPPAPPEEEAILLSPFEVTTSQDNGYQATETLAGTRIRTQLKDVAASITVVTREFLNDVGATDSGTLLQYTPSVDVGGTRGTYAGVGNAASVNESGTLISPASAQRVRGLAAADNARDYFVTDISWNSYNIDRVDILRGPNSILFGLGSPAGIVNTSTRNAEFRTTGEYQMRMGSYGSVRNSFDYNQLIVPGVLAVRLDGVYDDQKYQQDPAFQQDKRIYGALRYDPQIFKRHDFHTSFKAKFETGDIDANRPRNLPPNDSITPWWRPTAVTAANPFGGLGQLVVNNPYDPWRNDTENIVAGDGRGTTQPATVNFQPWLSDLVNQQQPVFFIDGANNKQFGAFGGYINNGALDSTGAFTGVSSGLVGKRQNGIFYGIASLPSAVTAAHNANAALYPDAQYGQYRTMSLNDASVFDFYNQLIDGDSKREWEHWNTQNFDLSQTAYDDRFGINVSYDHQEYERGGESLLGWSPTLTLDITKNLADYYALGSNGQSGTSNPNFGRPYVAGAGGNGGSSYESDREYLRASLFAELRADDITSNDFLIKLLGKQRFNFVSSDEKYYNENLRWQMYANSQAWAGYWNGNSGASSAINDRTPTAVIYLGPSVIGQTSASGANIPNIGSAITLPDSGVRVFDTTWTGGTNYGAAWTVPANLMTAFNPTDAMTQASNPANYKGWSTQPDNLLRYNDGENNDLLTLAQKSLRQTISYAGSYQGYFWNEAFVATLGWRFDKVKTKDITAKNQALNRSILDTDPSVYALPDEFPEANILKGHSTSGGGVLHLNKLLANDPLPLNISLSYNESSNFQVTSVRRDIYGNTIGNPSGETKESGVLIATKDGKYSLRATKYTTKVANGSSTLGDSYKLGQIIQQGLKWRNVFLYDLGGYDLGSRDQPNYRNTWTNAYPNLTDAEAQAEEDAAITGWNDIQKYLQGKGYFSAWNFNPLNESALVSRTQYLTNPAAYAPDPATVYSYAAAAPQGFSVTADTESKGYEFELTANPLPNWRLSFNASQTVATQSNVGGEALSEFVDYLNSQLINSDGTLTPAGKLPQFGGASNAMYPNIWGPWLSNYTLLKLQEGSAVSEIRKWRYNVITNYTFKSGPFKDVGLGGSYRWQDKVVIGYPVVTGGAFASYNLDNPIYGPAEDAIDLWASYNHKITKKVNWKIQLNVRNAFADEGLIPISVEPDGTTIAAARIKPTQEWFLTNTFSF